MDIVIIDDHIFIAESISKMIGESFVTCKITTYHNASFFLKQNVTTPDLIITDLIMPELSGIDLIKALRGQYPKTKLIVLSSITETSMIKECLKMGVQGYLSKEVRIQELLKAIDIVISDGQYIEQKLKDKLLKNYIASAPLDFKLSAREKEILKLLCDGQDPKDISEILCISVHTVYSHQQNMMRKMDINRTADLIVFALKNGLV